MTQYNKTVYVGTTGIPHNINIRRYDRNLLLKLAEVLNAPDPDGWSRLDIYSIGYDSTIGVILGKFAQARPNWIEMHNDGGKSNGHFTRHRILKATAAGVRAFKDVGITLNPPLNPAPPAPVPAAEAVIDQEETRSREEIEAENAKIIRDSGLFTEIVMEEFPMLRILTGELARMFPMDATCGHDAELEELARLRAWREKVLAG